MTWENFDFIGAILNNPTKLGVFLESFNSVDWNYNYSLMDTAYDNGKADTYGYLLYRDGMDGAGTETDYYSYQHPLINFNYLIGLIFAQLGFTLSIPTAKNNFLQRLIIRPNKEYDRYLNNVFTAFVDHYPYTPLPQTSLGRIGYINEDTGTSPDTPSFGNNSYYFKSWMDVTDGEDSFYTDHATVKQPYRFKSFANSGSTLTISDYNPGSGGTVKLRRYKESDETISDVFTITGNGSYTLLAEEGDWFWFVTNTAPTTISYNVTITTAVDSAYKDIVNPLRFPSLFHIPTCIDLTVGEFINQALQLTCSELTYDVNSDTYNFSARTKENGSAYDITKTIKSVKEITYDNKYVYSKLAESNIFKYLSQSPINADYPILIDNDKLVPTLTFIDLKFATSNTQSGGPFDGTAVVSEHTFTGGQIYTEFTEKPLHLLWNDTTNGSVYFSDDLLLENVFNLFWTLFWSDLISLALAGTARLLKVNTEIGDIEFKRINTKGTVYIKTYGKFYGIIEITKNGDFAEFFLLELY